MEVELLFFTFSASLFIEAKAIKEEKVNNKK